MIKKIGIFLTLFFLASNLAHAENAPLRIAITGFTPPFVMRAAKNEYYGFDISLTQYICQMLQRRCEYVAMEFSEFIPAIELNQVDIAISAIAINLEQSKIVRFSIPYMISETQFITTNEQSNMKTDNLNNMTVGVMANTIYKRELEKLAFNKLRVVEFKHYEGLLSALRDNTINIGLVRAPTAHYWKNLTSGKIQTVGSPINMGYGLGIMANINNQNLIGLINFAILKYQNSAQFKKNYNIYLNNF